MKRKSISTTSPPSDDAPQITKAFFEKGEHLIAARKSARPNGKKPRAQLQALGKKRVSIMLDVAIIEYFKTMAGDRGYQTLINETLKKAMSGQALASELRLVVREELAANKVR